MTIYEAWNESLELRILFAGMLITIILLLYTRYRRKRHSYLPKYAKTKPTKQGDYYSIISFWSTDPTSQDMVIHNINPNAEEAKMIILKSNQGYIMQMYDRSGNMMYENRKMTTFDLAYKFMELRQPLIGPTSPPQSRKPKESRTVEFK